MTDPKELHRRATERFGRHVQAIRDDQWAASTPCTDWDVRALVRHLVSESRWMPPLLAGRSIGDVGDMLDGDLLGPDPKVAWDRAATEMVVAVEEVDPGAVVHVSYGDISAGDYIQEVFTDLVIHGWDLARAIGADETLDAESVDLLYASFAPREDQLKASGGFGPKVVPPAGADTQTRLLAVFGRVT